MSDWLAVIILGIIEGITEFIPVSSTGHLLIAEKLLHSKQSDLFNVVIQGGAVLAVIPLFWQRFKQFWLNWREPATRDLLLKVIAAFGLTGVGGLVLDKMGLKFPEQSLPVGCALFIGGVIFILVEFRLDEQLRPLRGKIAWNVALAMGGAQLVAMIFPGASRSGTTIILAIILGLNRIAATEFSFLIGIPTMLAASGWKILKAIRHPVTDAPEHWDMVLLGTLVSAAVSFIAVKWLLGYVKTHTFTAFGWYRVALGMGVVFLLR